MEFEYPCNQGFTIYSKSGCPNCTKVKHMLNAKNITFNVIDCDEYILENKELFLSVINKLSQIDIKQFPIIFYDGILVGGYNETKEYISKNFLSFEDNLDF
jgi:glutaredoxin